VELRIRSTLLHRRLAVVAVSSFNRSSGCWGANEAGAVAVVLQQLRSRQGLGGVPLYVLGLASGGELALQLPQHAALLPEPLEIKVPSCLPGCLPGLLPSFLPSFLPFRRAMHSELHCSS
jgi:hypothetical protein